MTQIPQSARGQAVKKFGVRAERRSPRIRKAPSSSMRVVAKQIQEAAKERRSLTNYLEATLSEVWEQRQASEDRAKTKKQK
jgi:hypothetical protein